MPAYTAAALQDLDVEAFPRGRLGSAVRRVRERSPSRNPGRKFKGTTTTPTYRRAQLRTCHEHRVHFTAPNAYAASRPC